MTVFEINFTIIKLLNCYLDFYHNSESRSLYFKKSFLIDNFFSISEMNARTANAYMNGQSLKLNQVNGQSAITLTSDAPTHMVENSLLMENSISNSHFPRLNMNIFPPPGLTIDPSKLCQFQSTTTLQSQQRPASYITLPPPQVVNGIVTVERQKQMNVSLLKIIIFIEIFLKYLFKSLNIIN